MKSLISTLNPKKMYKIPTERKWIVWGRTALGDLAKIDRCDSEEDAINAAKKMRESEPELNIEIELYDSVIPDRRLPTQKQIEEICSILHGAFVMIRNLGHGDGYQETMREIAEVLHETPVEMYNPNCWDWRSTLARLRDLEKRYPDSRTYQMARRFEEIYLGLTKT